MAVQIGAGARLLPGSASEKHNSEPLTDCGKDPIIAPSVRSILTAGIPAVGLGTVTGNVKDAEDRPAVMIAVQAGGEVEVEAEAGAGVPPGTLLSPLFPASTG